VEISRRPFNSILTSHGAALLAMAYYMQYIPGAESPETSIWRSRARAVPEGADARAENDVATQSIASSISTRRSGMMPDSGIRKPLSSIRKTRRILHAGRNCLTRWYRPWAEARAKLGMKPEDPGPIKDKRVREELKTQYLPVITAGLDNLQRRWKSIKSTTMPWPM